MGCSPGKYERHPHAFENSDVMPLSPVHFNSEISEFHLHGQPWDKSFTRTETVMSTKTYTRTDYSEKMPAHRHDIDGLRAVAVLVVVLYHLNSSWLPTGLVGVDIFFVVSGFVVSSSLQGHFDEDESMWAFGVDFFARRAKRLLPTALAVICSAALALALVAPHWDPRAERFLLVGLSGTFANANNWLVYERDDYMDFFSNDVHDYNPFLHLWSLGVEEQFYLVVPWLLYGSLHSLERGGGGRTWIFMVLSLLSVAFGWWIDQVQGLPYFAFYLLPARFWELAAGVILFLFSAKKESIITDMLTRQPAVLMLLQAWTCLLWLVAFLVKFEEKNFPLPGALMPVVGTVCFILCGFAPFSILNKALTWKPMVYIGRISYCIYLWHVPVLALCRWLTLGSDMDMSLRVFSLIPTALLSVATHHLVEAPVRKMDVTATWSLALGLMSSLAAAVFVILLLVIRHSVGDSYFLWLACVALLALLVLFVIFSCQREERPGTRNVFIFLCILVCAAFAMTYNIYHDNVGLHSAQQVMVNPAQKRSPQLSGQTSCTACSCVAETMTYHLPADGCNTDSWSCEGPPRPCFEGTPLSQNDFQPHVPWGHENCLGAAIPEEEILSRCLTPEPQGQRSVWIIGDSHSFALVPCIEIPASAAGMAVHNYSWVAHHACELDWGKVVDALDQRVNPGDVVAFSTCFYCMQWCLPHFEELIQRLIALVQAKDAKLLIFKDVPLLNRNSLNCANSDPRQLTECAISVEQAQSDVKEATEMLDAYAKDFDMIDLFTPMCAQGQCDIFVPGTSAVGYVDKTHINMNGCHYLAPFICSGMRSLGYMN